MGGINETYIQGYADDFIGIINDVLLPVLIALAFIVFIWGVFNYFILGADNDEKRATGRTFVLWGIIGFVVIFSLWGLVAIVGETFGLSDGERSPTPPTFNPTRSGH